MAKNNFITRALSKVGKSKQRVKSRENSEEPVEDIEEDEIGAFYHFAEFPLEIRLKIWNYAMPLFPRIIYVEPFQCKYRNNSPHNVVGAAAIASSEPTLLHVNYEARHELWENFFNPFATRFCGKVCGKPTIPLEDLLVNNHIDTILILSSMGYDHPRAMVSFRWHTARTIYMVPPQDLPGIKERDTIVNKRDTFWTTLYSESVGCVHWGDLDWLNDWDKLEELVGKGKDLAHDNSYFHYKFNKDKLFGAECHSYLRKSTDWLGRLSRPGWNLKIHRPDQRKWRVGRRFRKCNCAQEHICPGKQYGNNDQDSEHEGSDSS